MAFVPVLTLAQFLTEERKHPWLWGVKDCTTWTADWIWGRTGIDPAASFRGAYHDQASCEVLLDREGGFVPLVGMCLDECGLGRTQNPKEGDVGIVDAPYRLGDRLPVVQATMAICQGDAWIMRKFPRGFHIERLKPLTAWAVP